MIQAVERQNPAEGQVWRHFKHTAGAPKEYRVLCVTSSAEPCESSPLHLLYDATLTESGVTLALITDGDGGYWLTNGEFYLADPHVVYKSVSRLETPWARPLDNFMSVDDRSPTGFRFERID